MNIALNDLESDGNVFRYAWFSGRATNVAYSSLLGNTEGSLTMLGSTYNTYINGDAQCPGWGITTSTGTTLKSVLAIFIIGAFFFTHW